MTAMLTIDRGDEFTATKDYDGYPAVRVQNKVWVEEPRWIVASALDEDQERNVRDLAAAPVKMADNMARMRRTERAS